MLIDGVVTADELNAVRELIDEIIEYGEATSAELESSFNELLGMISGIVADGKVTEQEYHCLNDWLKDNDLVVKHWPANAIAKRIRDILAAGLVAEDELSELLTTLKQMCGNEFEDTGLADGGVAEVFSDDLESFDHNGRTICFTGKFVCGTRAVVENTAIMRGAATSKNVTKKIDTLVIGTLASRDWRITSHGRKIEKALQLQKDGVPIVILSERHWRKFI